MKHSVDGASAELDREDHFTIHTNITESDWTDEEEKMNYLFNDLDCYYGRDNGTASWIFQATHRDSTITTYPENYYPDMNWMANFGEYMKGQYESIDAYRLQHEARGKEMIMGGNPHPTYPTLNWGTNCGVEPYLWRPLYVETSADWVAQYLDTHFAKSNGEMGQPMPMYWEVVNEIDMKFMTGQAVQTSLEEVFKYHNLVADKVRAKLGSNAPLIGGPTFGQFEFEQTDGLGRITCRTKEEYMGSPWNMDEITAGIWADACESEYWADRKVKWWQWDAMYKGFIDKVGDNMDFYSLHIYDWPSKDNDPVDVSSGRVRSGGSVEAILETMDWYQRFKYGKPKPIIISEYGGISGNDPAINTKYLDWARLRSWNQMLMQFLERPDIIDKTMAFAPVKALWGASRDADGNITSLYSSALMEYDLNDPNKVWRWRENIRFFELWSEVKGTRVDTKASDLDIQVDCYVDGKDAYLIVNNLQDAPETVKLNYFEDFDNNITSTKIKYLYLNGKWGDHSAVPAYEVTETSTPPSVIQLAADATMIIKVTFENDVNISETSEEKKFYSEPLDPAEPYRAAGDVIGMINNVVVPSKGEAMLRITGRWNNNSIVQDRTSSVIQINGHDLEFNSDWRGIQSHTSWFGVLEINVPLEYLQTNNTVNFAHSAAPGGETVIMSLQVFDMSKDPGRTNEQTTDVSVTGVSVSPTSTSLGVGETQQLSATVSPSNATDTSVSWSSDNTAIATVDSNGLVSAVSTGSATITVTTTDGDYTATCDVTVNTTSSEAPVVSFVNPTNGENFAAPGDVHVTVDATDADGTISNVVLYLDNTLVRQENVAPYDWNGSGQNDPLLVDMVAGTYTLRAVATDNDGKTGEASISITVGGGNTGSCDVPFNSTGTTISNETQTWSTGSIDISCVTSVDISLLASGVGPMENSDYLNIYYSLNGGANVAILENTNDYPAQTLTIDNISGNTLEIIVQAKSTEASEIYTVNNIVVSGEITNVSVTGVSVSPTSTSLGVGETQQLSATVSPSNATNTSVGWSSDNTAVATVNSNGLVSAVSAGSATVTVTTTDGNYTATATVSVSDGGSCDVPYTSTGTTISNETKTWSTGAIDVSCVNSVNISLLASGVGPMENADYLNIYYKVDGGSNIAILENVNNYTAQTLTVNNINGNTLEIIVEGKTSTSDEIYTVNDISVVNSSTTMSARIGPNEKLGSDAIKVYPTPVTDFLYIDGMKNEKYHLTLLDMRGAVVLDRQIIGSPVYKLDISGLQKGVYILHVNDEKIVRKIIVH
ncbi:hypothetical protein MHTCC0001_06210 [Flavobacteriaceae bacterium MHTCC 0001]